MILREIKNMYFPIQRIEYLESTGTQYIDTGIVPSETFYSVSIIVDIQFTDLTQRQLFGSTDAFYFGVNNGSWEMHFTIYKNYADTYRHVISKEIQKSTLKTIFNLDNAYTDSQPYSAIVENNLYKNTAYLFALNDDNNAICMCKCRLYGAKIYIDDVLVRDFTPVRVGNVGYMYDKVTKQLFSNAGTGNFVLGQDVDLGLQQIYQNRLIEGVDYETADWLKADIPINTSMMQLPINSKNFEFQRNWIQLMNSSYFSISTNTNSYLYYLQNLNIVNSLKPMIWDETRRTNAYFSPIKVGLGINTIIANDSEVTISSATNTATLPWYGWTGIKIIFYNASNENRHTIHLTSSIKVDGVTRYVPCQLLHAIPRNLDAQCKERVAGECGMIDLISGKFYGNVANSGTFTVENDNN